MSPDTAELAAGADERADTVPDDERRVATTQMRALTSAASDIEPYIGLRYLSKLFRFMAIILVLLLVAEVVTGLMKQGSHRNSHPARRDEPPASCSRDCCGARAISRFCSSMSDTTCGPRAFSSARQVAHQGIDQPPAARPLTPDRQAELPHRRSTEITTR